MSNICVTFASHIPKMIIFVPAIKNKIAAANESGNTKVVFTRDTHTVDYLNTQEGRHLPVSHCVKDTDGWQICSELMPYAKNVVDKVSFGSVDLPSIIAKSDNVESIELCGLCTDICVISNAMILKATFPETKISVDSSCCAGVTVDSHNNALNAMRMTQIEII